MYGGSHSLGWQLNSHEMCTETMVLWNKQLRYSEKTAAALLIFISLGQVFDHTENNSKMENTL